MNMKLLPPDHPMLREIAKPVEDPTTKLGVCQDMVNFIRTSGIGLAAPQIGISERFFVIFTGGTALHLINPTLEEAVGETNAVETCFSCGTAEVWVKRPERVRVQYWDAYGNKKRHWLSGLRARVFAHELDHLDGKLIHDVTG